MSRTLPFDYATEESTRTRDQSHKERGGRTKHTSASASSKDTGGREGYRELDESKIDESHENSSSSGPRKRQQIESLRGEIKVKTHKTIFPKSPLNLTM